MVHLRATAGMRFRHCCGQPRAYPDTDHSNWKLTHVAYVLLVILHACPASLIASTLPLPQQLHSHEEMLLQRFHPKSIERKDIMHSSGVDVPSNRRILTSSIAAQAYASPSGTYFQVNALLCCMTAAHCLQMSSQTRARASVVSPHI